MLVHEYAAQLAFDSIKARENSVTLWRNILAANGEVYQSCGVAHSNDNLERRPLNLLGRYRVGDGNEFPCEIPEISPQGLRIKGPKPGSVGKWCTARIASIGIIEGLVVQARLDSFVVGVIAPPRRLRRLAQRLHWQMLRNDSKVPERRASERFEMDRASATLSTANGQSFHCEIYDVSDGGAALHLGGNALYFWEEQPVILDGRSAQVLRHFPGGLVIKFDEAPDRP
jgi:hypothetical protein